MCSWGTGDSLGTWTVVPGKRQGQGVVQGGQELLPSFHQCFRISLCPLFTLLLRVPAVLRVITENFIPHPFTFQAAKRLQPPRENDSTAPLSRKLVCGTSCFSFLKSLPIPSLCPSEQTLHSPLLRRPRCSLLCKPHPKAPGRRHLAKLHGFSPFNLLW